MAGIYSGEYCDPDTDPMFCCIVCDVESAAPSVITDAPTMLPSLSPSTAPTIVPRVTGFVLVDAGQIPRVDIGPIADGATIDLDTVGTSLSIRVITDPLTGLEVDMAEDILALSGALSASRTESEYPYTVNGRDTDDAEYFASTVLGNPGTYTLTATPRYLGSSVDGIPSTLTITVNPCPDNWDQVANSELNCLGDNGIFTIVFFPDVQCVIDLVNCCSYFNTMGTPAGC